jgi:hypothetical protein
LSNDLLNLISETETELQENAWILPRDKFTVTNLFHASCGEKVNKAAVQINFKRTNGYHIKANPFNDQYRYCCGKDMDLIIQDMTEGYKTIAAIEVKNLAEQNRPYGTDFVKRHVLPRAKDIDPFTLKILVITFKKLLTKAAIDILQREGWAIIEVGERITYEFFRDMPKLYALAARIKAVIPSRKQTKPTAKPRTNLNFSCITLDNYTVDNNHNLSNNNLLHDTPTSKLVFDEEKVDIILENLKLLRLQNC